MEKVASLEFPFLLPILTFSFFQVLLAINMAMYYTAPARHFTCLGSKENCYICCELNRKAYGKINTPGKKYQAFPRANKTAATTAG